MPSPTCTPRGQRPTQKPEKANASFTTRCIVHILESFAIAGCALYPTAAGVQFLTAIQAKNDTRHRAKTIQPASVFRTVASKDQSHRRSQDHADITA